MKFNKITEHTFLILFVVAIVGLQRLEYNNPDVLEGTENSVFYYWKHSNIEIMTTSGKQNPASYPYF